LKNLALSYLLIVPEAAELDLARLQFDNAGNMTDRAAALAALIHSGSQPHAQAALTSFYTDFENEALGGRSSGSPCRLPRQRPTCKPCAS